MCVCMYTMCVCNTMYVCMYVCKYVCMYVCMCVWLCMYVHMCVCMIVYVCMCVCKKWKERQGKESLERKPGTKTVLDHIGSLWGVTDGLSVPTITDHVCQERTSAQMHFRYRSYLKSWLPWQRALKATQSCLYEAWTMRLTQSRSATGSQHTAGPWGTQSRPRYVGLLLGAGLWGSARMVCQGRSHEAVQEWSAKNPTNQHVTWHDAMQWILPQNLNVWSWIQTVTVMICDACIRGVINRSNPNFQMQMRMLDNSAPATQTPARTKNYRSWNCLL